MSSKSSIITLSDSSSDSDDVMPREKVQPTVPQLQGMTTRSQSRSLQRSKPVPVTPPKSQWVMQKNVNQHPVPPLHNRQPKARSPQPSTSSQAGRDRMQRRIARGRRLQVLRGNRGMPMQGLIERPPRPVMSRSGSPVMPPLRSGGLPEDREPLYADEVKLGVVPNNRNNIDDLNFLDPLQRPIHPDRQENGDQLPGDLDVPPPSKPSSKG